jgi:hypothetical protein
VSVAAVDQDGVALEHVAIAIPVAGRRLRMRNTEDIAEVTEERILVRPLRGGRLPPFFDEGGCFHELGKCSRGDVWRLAN